MITQLWIDDEHVRKLTDHQFDLMQALKGIENQPLMDWLEEQTLPGSDCVILPDCWSDELVDAYMDEILG